jgi:hypothetical protein
MQPLHRAHGEGWRGADANAGVAAVRDKARVMRLLQLHDLGRTGRACLALPEEDPGRLAGE